MDLSHSELVRRSLVLNDGVASDDARAAHGLVPYWYTQRGKPVPPIEMTMLLCVRLIDLLRVSSAEVDAAVRERRLKPLLGDGFEWVMTPFEM